MDKEREIEEQNVLLREENFILRLENNDLEAQVEKVRKKTAKEILVMIDSIPTNEVNELNHLSLLKKAIIEKYGVEIE